MTAPILSSTRTPRVLVVGVGASPLVAELLRFGHHVVAVDIASAALEALVGVLGKWAAALADGQLELVVADVRSLRLDQSVDVWHDRAVFHFLIEPADRAAYAEAAAAAVTSGGHLVMATFAPDGPTSCSGLAVTRHDAGSLGATFAPHFELVESFEVDHVTPWGSTQRFTHALFRRA
ncbi:MAG: methyltransferase domain-containing protein [Actinomycetota bacterium]|nr:methyltransferase domain-containing protein [Actinomycetota bacterium]